MNCCISASTERIRSKWVMIAHSIPNELSNLVLLSRSFNFFFSYFSFLFFRVFSSPDFSIFFCTPSHLLVLFFCPNQMASCRSLFLTNYIMGDSIWMLIFLPQQISHEPMYLKIFFFHCVENNLFYIIHSLLIFT